MTDFKNLLDVLENRIASTPLKKDADFGPLVSALDAVLDEIKSGDDVSPYVDLIVSLFKKLLSYPKWDLVQSTTYGFAALFRGIGATVDGLLTESPDAATGILHILFGQLGSEKRELRDAAAQCLGVLSASLGSSFVARAIPLIQRATKNNDTWQTLEGYMIAIGYIGSNAADITADQFRLLASILLEYAQDERFPGYSNYVRLRALRALERIIRVGKVEHLWVGTNLQASFEQIILSRLDDQNIDVRKAAAKLYNSFSFATLAESARDGDSLALPLLAHLDQTKRWENRHGVCVALSLLCQHPPVVARLTGECIERLVSSLVYQVSHPLVSDDATQSASVIGSANATAAVALTDLYLSITRTRREPPAPSAVDALADRIAALDVSAVRSPSGGTPTKGLDLQTVFESKVFPQLVFLLNSAEATLLDAGGTCVHRLIADPDCALVIQTQLSTLQCLIFKNKFHSSLPIRDSAIRNWRASIAKTSTEGALLAALTPQLVTFLLTETAEKNTDVRESVFKGLEEVLGQKPSVPALLESSQALAILRALFVGTTNTAGNLPDYPRAAATAALSRYLAATNEQLRTDGAVVEVLRTELPPLLVTLIGADAEAIVIEALKCVSTVVQYWADVLGTELVHVLAAPVISVAHSSLENVRFAAVPVLVALVGGDLNGALVRTPALGASIVKGLSGRFGLSEDGNPEEENREAASRAVRYVAEAEALGSGKLLQGQVPALVQLAAEGLLRGENRDSAVIKANSLAALVLLLHSISSAEAGSGADPNTRRLLGHLLRFLTASVRRAIDDFEVPDALFDPESADDDEDHEDGDVDADDNDDEDMSGGGDGDGTGVEASEAALDDVLLVTASAAAALRLVAPPQRVPYRSSFITALNTLLTPPAGKGTAAVQRCRALALSLLGEDVPAPPVAPALQQFVTAAKTASAAPARLDAAAALSRAFRSAAAPGGGVDGGAGREAYDASAELLTRATKTVTSIDGRASVAVLADLTGDLACALIKGAPAAAPPASAVLAQLCKSIVIEEEEDDESENASLWAVQHNLIPSQFSIIAVNAHLLTAAETVLKAIGAASQGAVVDDLFGTLLKKSSSDDDDDEEADDGDEEDEDDQDRARKLKLLDHIARTVPAALTSQRMSLAQRLSAHVTAIKSEDDADDAYPAACSALAAVVGSASVPELQEGARPDWIDAILRIAANKWFRSIADGRAIVALSAAVSALLRAFPQASVLERFLQMVADLLADEDVGEVKDGLVPVLEAVAALVAPRRLFLPAPTSIAATLVNEQFSKFA